MKKLLIFLLISAVVFANTTPEQLVSEIRAENHCTNNVCINKMADEITYGQYTEWNTPEEASEKLSKYLEGCQKNSDAVCESFELAGHQAVWRKDKMLIPICSEITSGCISNNFVEYGTTKETIWWRCGSKLNYIEIYGKSTVYHTEPGGKQLTYAGRITGEFLPYAEEYAELMESKGLCEYSPPVIEEPEPVVEKIVEENEVVEEPIVVEEEAVEEAKEEKGICVSAFVLFILFGFCLNRD
ncbi:hypothetical protein JXB01_03920 [Candidatus Micrarchaeota archaeon]|nr:hypothetical protein [Candidatus Micrarchaeota archaeon]